MDELVVSSGFPFETPNNKTGGKFTLHTLAGRSHTAFNAVSSVGP